MIWLLAAIAVIFATALSVAHPIDATLAHAMNCAGALHCDGPPSARSVSTAQRSSGASVFNRAANREAPRLLTPAQLGPKLSPLSAPGTVLDVHGRAFTIVAKLAMSATAYTTGEPGVGRITYTGTRARVGEAAVDPRFLPLGSWLYVTGYHTPDLPAQGILEHAEDIGGLIKGNRIDLYMSASFHALAVFGRQPVTVYLLMPRDAGTSPAMPGGIPK